MPRYENYRPRSVRTSQVGASNRRQNTTPEILLRKALSVAGVRYRLQSSTFVSGGDKFDSCGGRKSDSRQHDLAAG